MKDIRTLHEEAMDIALQGDMAARDGNTDAASELYGTAFEKEREAALLADFLHNPEPGLSVLLRSAASLALQCGRLREGEQLIARALSGNPHPEIASELRELLQQIYSSAEKDCDIVVYEVKVPQKERSRLEVLLGQLGDTVHAIRKAAGCIAL